MGKILNNISRGGAYFYRGRVRLKSIDVLRFGVGIFGLFLLGPLVQAEEPIYTADALVNYAESLGRTGEAVQFGPGGLVLHGASLKGATLVRPSIALARAAEIYAEAAGPNNSKDILNKALVIWKTLNDSHTPVAYLRHYSQEKKTQNPGFAIYCEVKLAGCYTAQGDQGTAETLLSPYATQDASNDMIALAKAVYASYLLNNGDVDGARDLAQDVIEKVPHADFEYKISDGYDVALSVLAAVPSASKAGSGTGSASEAKILKDIEGNPRRYLLLGDTAYGAGDKQKAILYWGEYRKRFPTDESARYCSMKTAKAYEEIKELDKAIQCYREIIVQYPDFNEGWQACIKATQLLIQTNKSKDAFDVLESAAGRIKSAQGQAWIQSAQAQLMVQNRMMDQAADKYIGLLIKYGDQDAAKDAVVNLRKIAPQIKNWKYFTLAIQNWLGGKSGRVGQVGNSKLNLSDASQLRRLALGFYVENNDSNGGIIWLKALGMQSEEKERNWFVRDEAWLDAQLASGAQSKGTKLTRHDLIIAVKLGMNAWEIAPGTEEGLVGLKAAQALIITPPVDKVSVKQYIKTLENLRGGESDSIIVELLVPLYNIVGDQKSLDAIRQSSGN